MGDQPGRLVIQELQKLWKLHAKLLAENRIAKPATDKKVTKPSDLKKANWYLSNIIIKAPSIQLISMIIG